MVESENKKIVPVSREAVAPFSERHPILKQAWDDACRLSWQQVGVPALGALANFLVSLFRDWQAGRLDASLSAKNLFWSLIIGVVLYAIVAALRAPFEVIARHHRQLSDIHQRLMDAEGRLTEASAVKQLPASTKTEPKEPNIVYLSAEIVEAHRQHHGGIYEGRGPYDSLHRRQNWFWACVASFRNEVLKNREIGGRGLVSAKISYAFQGQNGSNTASRAAWFGSDRFQVTFGINDTNTLVVATFEDGYLFAIQENASRGFSDDRTKHLPLLGDLHKVHIELISESESKVLCSTDLILEITRDPELNIELRLDEEPKSN